MLDSTHIHRKCDETHVVISLDKWEAYLPFLCGALGLSAVEDCEKVKALPTKVRKKKNEQSLEFTVTGETGTYYVHLCHTVDEEAAKIHLHWSRIRDCGSGNTDMLLS